MTRWLLFVCIAPLLLLGCTSNTELVKKIAAVELKCNESDLSVTYKDSVYTGTNSYEAHGCNQTRTYVCDRWTHGVSIATTGQAPFAPVCEHAW